MSEESILSTKLDNLSMLFCSFEQIRCLFYYYTIFSLKFHLISKSGRNSILEYLEEFEIYEEIEVNDRNFVLVHGGLVGFSEDKDLSEYGIHDIIWGRCDYEKQYYTNKFLVTGHTPTHMDFQMLKEKC